MKIKLPSKFPWIVLIVLAIAVAGSMYMLYKHTFDETNIKAQSAFKQRVETTELTVRAEAEKQLPPSIYQGGPTDQKTPIFEKYFATIQTQNIFRLKVWSTTSQILWANAVADIGKSYPDNKEVTEALSGETAVELEGKKDVKGEHVSEQAYTGFTEIYVPIESADGKKIAVIETYQGVNDILDSMKKSFWKTTAAVSAIALLIVGLCFWLSRRPRTRR